jgi:chromosome segregation protein
MHLSRLRLIGFKSFVDATELAIEPGLTGIVGPNGCGKSNLVEALRWVMGEGSARRLRGGDMDDVIFAGTAARPARNIAEVAVSLDNSGRAAPLAFNNQEEIEVVRRIERNSGSTYRINGREVRARDVQLLFADAASGAHSGAMVSQGRIGALIEAKPAERRLLLEEAAGTAGLHARRRETELKLAAAEENLARLDDVMATIALQFEALKKQARQAQRYRRLADQIRRTEALLFRARWLAAETEAERAAAALRADERAVAEATENALIEAQARAAAEAGLPPLRLADAAAAAELQRLTHGRSGLEQELQRVLAARRDAEKRLTQLAADIDREEIQLAEAVAALDRLSKERETITRADAEDGPARVRAEATSGAAAERLVEAEAALQRQTEAVAAADARRGALQRNQRELAERRARLQARRSEAERQRASLAGELVAPEAVTAVMATVAEAERRVEQCRGRVEAGEGEIADRLAKEQAALDAARQADTSLARLEAEAEGLRALLRAASETSADPSVLSTLQVAAGFEAAIGAAFGDELSAPVADADAAAHRFWRELGGTADGAPLPDGARPLAQAISAPSAIVRSLAQAGWVETEETGHRLQPHLAPGQRLVDRDGRLWRWDGFTIAKPGSSTAAEQLRQRNRIAELDAEIVVLEAAKLETAQRAAAAQAERRRANEADRFAHHQLREAEAALALARTKEAELAQRQLSTETRLAASAEFLDKLGVDLAETETQQQRTGEDLIALPDLGEARSALDLARATAADARRREAEARAAIDRLSHEEAVRRQRLSAIDREEQASRTRRDSATAQQMSLRDRRDALVTEIAGLAARPAQIAAESEALAAAIAGAAADCRRAGDALALGESQLRQTAEGSRRADQALAEARERLARAEVLQEGAAEALARLAREIRERLDAAPEALADLAGQSAAESTPDQAETAKRLDRLLRERDGIGPVNLMAEGEAAELESRIATLERERADLTAAIARLRRGISTLDEEVRRRLAAAFERINGHFAQLFTRLFGGGKAHLALVDSEDPLAAGLEIMASPPGKKLQSLSLLSGGEQALTSLALIFALFLTNPAPVCVLDEVDAALDDANVDRFCSLVEEIADTAGTRFLVVTHHRITMARVDRLFGVTMTERGISRLVSVDLTRAASLRQTA